MTSEELKTKTKEQVIEFIRLRLSFSEKLASQMRYVDDDAFKNEHKRFEMSGYENATGVCTVHNMSVINEFAVLGIYDYTDYLYVDFYKGQGTLYLKYFNTDENLEIELSGYKTTEIIYEIFQKNYIFKLH